MKFSDTIINLPQKLFKEHLYKQGLTKVQVDFWAAKRTALQHLVLSICNNVSISLKLKRLFC